MKSVEERLTTFTNWKYSDNCASIRLAVCGFYVSCKKSFTVKCYICDIELEDWTGNEIPYVEHINNSPRCPLMNLNNYKNRIITFGEENINKRETVLKDRINIYHNEKNNKINPVNDINVSSKQSLLIQKRTSGNIYIKNYFNYKIKCNEDLILCFKCGIKFIEHKCKSNNFYKELLEGKYDHYICIVLENKLILKNENYETIKYLMGKNHLNEFNSIKVTVEKIVDKILKEMEENMEDDVEYCKKLFY